MDVFGDNEETVTTVDETTPTASSDNVDIWADKLKVITREDGTPKYKNVDEALTALQASQAHIAQLEAEALVLAEEARKAQTIQQQLDQLKGKPMNEENSNSRPAGNGGLSEEAVNEIVKRTINGERQTEAAINNVKRVQATLVSRFGSEAAAQQAIVARAKELGVTTQKLKLDSAESPDYVLALFGNSKPTPAPNMGTVNLSHPQPTDNEIKRPDKSVISGRGATDRSQTDLMRQIRESIHKKHGVTSS